MISLEPKICYRTLKKYGLSIRKVTHLGQTLPKNSIDYFYDFFYTVIKKENNVIY